LFTDLFSWQLLLPSSEQFLVVNRNSSDKGNTVVIKPLTDQ